MKVGLARIARVPHISMAEQGEKVCDHVYNKLTPLPGKDIPVWINHDKDRVIGRVRGKLERLDAGVPGVPGLWYCAMLEIDEPPSWLTDRTPVSLSTKPLYITDEAMAQRFYGREHVHDALVVEVSLLSPGHRPAEPQARMLTLRQERDPWEPKTLAELGPLTEANALDHWSARIELGEDPGAAMLDIKRKLAKQKHDPRLGRRTVITRDGQPVQPVRRQTLVRNCGTILGIS